MWRRTARTRRTTNKKQEVISKEKGEKKNKNKKNQDATAPEYLMAGQPVLILFQKREGDLFAEAAWKSLSQQKKLLGINFFNDLEQMNMKKSTNFIVGQHACCIFQKNISGNLLWSRGVTLKFN